VNVKRENNSAGVLYAIFFLSGISGLVYETVWLRMLIRVLGNTVYATSVILAAFMAGLAIGSYAIGRIAGRVRNGLLLYAFLELGVGLSAIALVWVFNNLTPVYRLMYVVASGHRILLTLFQSGLMVALLIIPTSLMGGTLPVLSAYTKRFQSGLSRRIGILYGSNTLGAFIGVVGSGMYAIGAWGEWQTIYAAAVLNLVVSFLAFRMSHEPAGAEGPASAGAEKTSAGPTPLTYRKLILWAYAASGFAAISYEIVWTRMFQIDLGTSIYAFSMMLGFYLLGIGVGSLTGGMLVRKINNSLRLFGWLQVAVAFYGVAGMYLLARFAPVSNLQTFVLSTIIIVPLLIVMPMTLVLGLMFPVVSSLYVEERETGRGVGRLYSANTIGCIAGSLVCGFLLIGTLGTRGTMLFLAGMNTLVGAAILLVDGRRRAVVSVALAAVAVAAAALLSPDPFLTAIGKTMYKVYGDRISQVTVYHNREHTAATTTALGITAIPLARNLFVNGIGMTRLCTETKLMAHLPLTLHRNPRTILVICFGMGTALKSAWTHEGISCDVVELDGDAYKCFKYFHANGDKVLADPRVRHYVDDGRNFLLMNRRTYDVITMDPSPPLWSAGTVNLYTREFFTLCRGHLAEGGIMCLWIPPANFTEVRMIMKTYQNVFPGTWVYSGPHFAGFYMIGSSVMPDTGIARFREVLGSGPVEADLSEWEPHPVSPEEFNSLYLMDPAMLRIFTGNAPVITDNNPYTEFPLWRSISDKNYQYTLDGQWLRSWMVHYFSKEGVRERGMN
jgi:spermidine synthase